MSRSLVSVVIPHFNRSKLLEAAVRSVLDSDYTDVEVIIVDDVSSKEERASIQRLAAPNVTIVDRDGMKGPSRCRNIGVSQSRGDFIVFLDSDDLMAPWCLSQRVAAAKKLSAFDAWVFPVLLFNKTPGDRDTLWNILTTQRGDALRFAEADPPWHTSSPLWKKEAFLRIGGFNERVFYGDDTDLHLRALVSGVTFSKSQDALPDVFVRRSDDPRITGSLDEGLIASRRDRLSEGTRALKSGNASSELRDAFAGQYMVEAEFLLFNAPDPRSSIQELLKTWKRDAPESPFQRAVAELYLRASIATRERAYLLVRIARRIALAVLPKTYFPRGDSFSMACIPLPVAQRSRAKLRESSQGPDCPEEVVSNDSKGWVGKEPTEDEREVVAWLAEHKSPSRVLHLGVGAAYLTQKLGKAVVQAITKDGAEAANARDHGTDTLLCNKYDVASYADKLQQPFDCIVDVNIRSYACCDLHFREYMEKMRESLVHGGVLLTNLRGLNYLRPTSLAELHGLCPGWVIESDGNVVTMHPTRD